MTARATAYRWFVEYNPLYFASALSILAGVFLLARELPPDDFASKLGIVAGTETYQLLLILGAWLLLRAGAGRPAALLGILALVFLLDGALSGERVFSHARTLSLEPGMRARRALPASLVLALLGPLKVAMLVRVFRLRHSRAIHLPLAVLVALLPLLPYGIEAAGPLEASRRDAHLAVFWLGAPLFGWGWTRAARGWSSRFAGGVADWIRISRIAQVTPFLALGLFGVHAWVWSTFPGLGLTPAHFAPYLLAGACVAAGRLAPNDARKAERIAWTGAAGAILATGVNSPPGAWPTAAVALMAGASLLGLIWRARLRLCLPAVVSTLGGLYLLHGGASAAASVPSAAWLGTLALLLLGGAVADRDFRALFTSALAAGGAVAALEPRADLAPYGLIAGAVWLAGLGVWIFPDVRRWLPAVAVLGILGVGTILLHREPGVNAPWFAATALSAFGAGLAFQARPLQWTGLSGFVPFGIEMRSRWMPDTGGGWGLTLLAAGFLLLSAGVAFNLLAARKRKEEPARDGSGDG